MRLKLLPYDLNVIYTPGKDMLIADTLSRAYDNTDKNDVDSSLNEVVHSVNFSDNRIEQIRKEIQNDEEMLLLIKYCLNGWPEQRTKIPDLIKVYWSIRNDIYVEQDLLFYQERLIIPKSMRAEILGILHESHMGISKTKYLAKTTLYWPRIYNDIEETIFNCRTCEKYRSSNSKRTLIPHDIPEIPFNKVACDLFQYKAKSYLVLVDYLSNWVEVCELQDKTSNEIKKHLKKIFCTHGIPETLIADNMPFNSFELRQFGKEWNFRIITSSPEYPRSNGLAEKGVHIAKSLLRKCEETNKDLESALLAYRNAPITGIKFSPSQILMSRLLRSKLPASNKTLQSRLCPNIIMEIKSKQEATKSYHNNHIRKQKEHIFSKGDNVVVQKGKIWEPAKVVGSFHTPRSYIVRTENNREIRRNSLHLRPSPHEPSFRVENNENESSNDTFEPTTNSDTQSASPGITSSIPFYVNRYGRVCKPPERYQAVS